MTSMTTSNVSTSTMAMATFVVSHILRFLLAHVVVVVGAHFEKIIS